MEKKRVFVVVIGMDQKGIIARVSTLFFEQGASIKGVQQKIVGGTFVMTMLADVSDCKVGLAGLHRDLEKTAKAVGLNVMIHKRVGFKSHAQGCRLMTDHTAWKRSSKPRG